jgi:hypothetical protein
MNCVLAAVPLAVDGTACVSRTRDFTRSVAAAVRQGWGLFGTRPRHGEGRATGNKLVRVPSENECLIHSVNAAIIIIQTVTTLTLKTLHWGLSGETKRPKTQSKLCYRRQSTESCTVCCNRSCVKSLEHGKRML